MDCSVFVLNNAYHIMPNGNSTPFVIFLTVCAIGVVGLLIWAIKVAYK